MKMMLLLLLILKEKQILTDSFQKDIKIHLNMTMTLNSQHQQPSKNKPMSATAFANVIMEIDESPSLAAPGKPELVKRGGSSWLGIIESESIE